MQWALAGGPDISPRGSMSPILPESELLERFSRLSPEEQERIAQLLGASSAARVAASESGPPSPTSPATEAIRRIRSDLEAITLLSVLTEAEREELACRVAPVAFGDGAFVVQEGATDRDLYLLTRGAAQVRVNITGSNESRAIAELSTGDYFGEMALLLGEPRKASVVANGSVEVLRVSREDFDVLLRGRPGIADELATELARREVELQAAKRSGMALLESLSEPERTDFLRRGREEDFAPGAMLLEEGAEGDRMGVILTGEAEVRVRTEGGGSRQVAILRGGDVFGEMSLLSGAPRTASVLALTRVSVHVVDKADFNAFLAAFPDVRGRLEQIRMQREGGLAAIRSGIEEEESRRRQRAAETRFAGRIRRLFGLGVPADASRLQAAPSTRCASGRLLFEYTRPTGEDKPLHNMEIELWHVGLIDTFLACSRTARDGSFELWYELPDGTDAVDLELRIFETHHEFTRDGELKLSNRLIQTIPGDQNVKAERVSFGDHRIPYWEYDPSNPMPRAMISAQGDPPQSFPTARSLMMVKVVAPLELAMKKHILQEVLTGKAPSLEQIQADYPESYTVKLERERPGYTRGDEFFGERMLNGLSAGVWDRDDANPGWWRVYHHWNSYEQDGIHVLPNVDMRFEERDGRMYPVQITLHLREPGVTQAHAETRKHTLTPADGERWLAAKRIARVSATLSAELDNHLVTTHHNSEQYAIAAYRNFRRNPLRYLLFPHLKEVVLIDHSSDSFLLGPNGYVTRATALTEESILERIHQVMGTLDWKNWSPIQPICGTHRYARVANLFWDVVSQWVEEFFDEHLQGITEHWYEVHQFSQDLVEHSAPDFLCRYLRSTADGKPPQARAWFNQNERMDLTVPRFVVNGVPRAVQPVTQTNIALSSDIENMKQVCRYAIFHATFKHTWANALQYVDGGEVVYNNLGLRYGDNGVFAPESDHSTAPTPKHATEALWISFMLTYGVYGVITKNEERDIHPRFVELLESRRGEFAALDFDIDTIQSRTNI